MARADSTVRVNIIGDAKSLSRAADTAEGSIKGMNKTLVKAGGVIAGAFVTDAVIDFGRTALGEADRVADAAGRIEAQLGPDLSRSIIDRADDFSRLGASEGDMLELEARIVDIGTAAGISAGELGPLAEDAAEVASAMALATDIPADEWIDKIGKAAASGDARALRDLGINLSDSAVAAQALLDTGKDLPEQLTAGELAAARQAIIIDTLRERYGDAESAGGDFEGRQATLQAKFETLSGKIGEHLEGPLNDLLEWMIHGIEGWELLAHWVGENESAFRSAATPMARFIDLLSAIWNLQQKIVSLGFDFLGGFINSAAGNAPSNRPPSHNRGPFGTGTVNVNVQGGSPEVIEQSVRRAIQHATGRGPLE